MRPRSPSSTVKTALALESWIRSLNASALKPGEHNVVNGPDSRAGQHSVDGFGNHGHVEGDNITLPNTAVFEDIGAPGYFFLQLSIRDVFLLPRLVLLPNQCDTVPHAPARAGQHSSHRHSVSP